MFKVKKFIFPLFSLLLVGCNAPQTPSSIGKSMYDMNAVKEYEAKIASGNTATEKQKNFIKEQAEPQLTINGSDRKSITKSAPVNVSILPAVGIGYYHDFGHRY